MFCDFLFPFCVYVVLHRFNHELVFGISVKNLSKAERLIYGDSLMTHAMILTAVSDKVYLHEYTAQVYYCFVFFKVNVQTYSTYTSRPTETVGTDKAEADYIQYVYCIFSNIHFSFFIFSSSLSAWE